jgi:hypothetical protein
MKKTLFVSLICFFIVSCGTSKNDIVGNFRDTSKYTLKDDFKNTYQLLKPGCIEIEKFNQLKNYLIEIYNVDIDSVGTLNIYYIMPRNKCFFDIYETTKIEMNIENKYKITAHRPFDVFTKVNFPVLFFQYETQLINTSWKHDKDYFLFNLFFNDSNKMHCDALVTVTKDRSYFLDWESFTPQTFNAFSNELPKYKCE